jgi:hypothetical protein
MDTLEKSAFSYLPLDVIKKIIAFKEVNINYKDKTCC